MSPSLSPSDLFWRVRRAEPERFLHQARRAALIARVRWLAAWHRASIELDLDPSIRLGRDVRIDLAPHTTNVLRIGPGGRIDDRVLIRLTGGRIELGPDCHLRASVVLNVAGHLEMVRGNILSWGTAVHCSESVRLEPLASAAEHVTVADSTHFFTTPDEFFYDNTRTAPIHIGANTWLCPKATVTSGVRIGSHCIIGSGSVVIGDVPDGHLASGVPATNRPLDLPWETERVTHG
jgi:acetyltransferase-like isoleucine patch superfamily enzyme